MRKRTAGKTSAAKVAGTGKSGGTAKEGEIATPQIRRFALSELRPADYNPRVISLEAMAALTASLERFGCVQPIIVNIRGGKNTIVGGHQRYAILKKSGAGECTCVTVNCDRREEKLLNLTLNNPQAQGRFIEQLDDYILQLQQELPDDRALLDLRIDQLCQQMPKRVPEIRQVCEALERSQAGFWPFCHISRQGSCRQPWQTLGAVDRQKGQKAQTR